VADHQRVAFRYFSYWTMPSYYAPYDVDPEVDEPDGDIDIKDLQQFFGRDDRNCPF
jgi:hypothetical protein